MQRPDFAELFAALPVAALVIDPDDRIADANALAEELLDISERRMTGRALATVLPLPRERRDGYARAAHDWEIATARGPLRADVHEAAVPDHAGWRLVTFHPTGARLGGGAGGRAAVGAAAMLAHEIRNPLSGIRGAAQLIAADDPRAELPRLIVTEVDRIAALIDRMDEFADTRPLPLAPANIYPLIKHVRQVAGAGFARGIPIEERFDPSLPPALIDDGALTQVLLNLLKNAAEAVRAVPAPRLVLTAAYRHGLAVSMAPDGPRVQLPIEICIRDNGPGAPAAIADHLFDPFVSGRPEGQGLGLALVDKLVGDMGGIVRYAREGSPPVTVFRLLLRRAPA